MTRAATCTRSNRLLVDNGKIVSQMPCLILEARELEVLAIIQRTELGGTTGIGWEVRWSLSCHTVGGLAAPRSPQYMHARLELSLEFRSEGTQFRRGGCGG